MSKDDTQLAETVQRLLQGAESVSNSQALSAYLINSGVGPEQIVEVLKGMLGAEVFVLSKFGKVIDSAPDWKIRGKALELLIDIYGGKFQSKSVEQLVPPQLLVFYREIQNKPIGELIQDAEDEGLEIPDAAKAIKRPARRSPKRPATPRTQAADAGRKG